LETHSLADVTLRTTHWVITICDVLLKLSERLGPNGTWKVTGYETTTFTRFPGALLVAAEQDDHVVGVELLAEHHVVVAVTLADLIPVYPSPCT
jgi:hypothetical protein